MTAAQKQAWFQLVVVTVTMVLVLALFPWMGPAAFGGFGLLGTLGLTPRLFRRKEGSGVLYDERDAAIQRRAVLIAYVAFWVVFVLVCVALPLFYGWEGAVPVTAVQVFVFVGLMIVTAVNSVATLVQYASGVADVA